MQHGSTTKPEWLKFLQHVQPCLFWVKHFVLCLRLVKSEVSVCSAAGNPQASVVLARHPSHTQTGTHTFWQTTRFTQSDLAVWEYRASHLFRVSASYTPCILKAGRVVWLALSIRRPVCLAVKKLHGPPCLFSTCSPARQENWSGL